MIAEGKKDELESVKICFSSSVLKAKDDPLYDQLKAVFHKQIEIETIDHKDQLTGSLSKTLVIYDEADCWWLDEKEPIVDAKWVVGFSATTHKSI